MSDHAYVDVDAILRRKWNDGRNRRRWEREHVLRIAGMHGKRPKGARFQRVVSRFAFGRTCGHTDGGYSQRKRV